MPGSEGSRSDSEGSNGGNNNAGVYSKGQGQESSPSLRRAINCCKFKLGKGANGCICFLLFFQGWLGRLSDWNHSILNLTHSRQHTDQSCPGTLAVCNWEVVPYVCCHIKGFFLLNQIWAVYWCRTPSLSTLPRPAGSRVWQICFRLGAYQQCPPSLEILSFTWTAVERAELFVQRMRRTGKKEEVNKCSFEHTCRTPLWRVVGMTEMTRAVGLSYVADKRKRARASPWNCTGEMSPSSLLLPSVGWPPERSLLERHVITLYFHSQSCPMSPVTWERCMHSGGQSVHPKAPNFHYS